MQIGMVSKQEAERFSYCKLIHVLFFFTDIKALSWLTNWWQDKPPPGPGTVCSAIVAQPAEASSK